MKRGTIQINQYATSENSVESYICFKKFIDFLQERVAGDKTIRVHFYKFVLDKLTQFPELTQGLSVLEGERYNEVLELIATIVLPLMDDEREALVGFAGGLSSQVFYATDAFVRLFEARAAAEHAGHHWIDPEASLQLHRDIQYYLILQKVYGIEAPRNKELLHSFFNPVTGLYTYFRLNIDARFVDVKVKSVHRAVTAHSIDACFADKHGAGLESLVELSNYIAKGFTIITLTDITAQQAIEQMSRIVTSIDEEKAAENFIHITRLMQTILGSSHYQFGIMPFFTVNSRAALLYENFDFSIIVKAATAAGIHKDVFTRYINHYLTNPRLIVYQLGIKEDGLPVLVQQALKASGIHYYILVPVYFNDTLVGILETGAAEGINPLTELQLRRLQPAIPYISQLLKLLIEKFNLAIDTIVKDKFTVIQPAVQWKFNEAAWHYFRNHTIEHRNGALEKISFKDVYPLYGSIDIRNSTIERNKALREDLQVQFKLLISLLQQLEVYGSGEKVKDVMKSCRYWLNKLTAYVSIEDELELNEFLQVQAHPLLISLTALPLPLSKEISDYYAAIDAKTGHASSRRRALESTIYLLNKSISRHFDLFKEDLQAYYPCYFEKFRTDGIEYDIYIGQSIAPKIPFAGSDVEKLRLWQVQSMAVIAKLTHALQKELDYPLHTTQLIFVNAGTIDISFRNDERRFDVEGAYNIRYHIIKKRIDKVNIRGSRERLTQPGKIAIVYFNERDATAYISYIQQLQEQHILLNDLEHLALEELQGVSGLKALRVGVQMV